MIRNSATALALAFGIAGAVLRALAIPAAVSDVDGVNFARGLRHFDPLVQSPHFPGYPVYMVLSRPFWWLGLSEPEALAAAGIVLWPVAAVALFAGLRRWVHDFAALGAVAVVSLAPGAVVVGGWSGSDGLGFSFLCASLGLLMVGLVRRNSQRFLICVPAAGLGLGLLLGIRLSWLPVVAMALLFAASAVGFNRERLAALVGWFGAGVLSWLLPMALLTGPGRLFDYAVVFVSGHFGSWGNTLFSQSAPRDLAAVVGRFGALVSGLVGTGLGAATGLSDGGFIAGGSLVGVVVLVVVVAGVGLAVVKRNPIGDQGYRVLRKYGALLPARTLCVDVSGGDATSCRRSNSKVVKMDRTRSSWIGDGLGFPSVGKRPAVRLFVATLPYLLWVTLAQDVSKVRHLLPLLLVVGVVLAIGLGRAGRRGVLVAVVGLLAMAQVAFSRAQTQSTKAAPALAMVEMVKRTLPAVGTAIFAGMEARVFEHHAREYRVMRPASLDSLRGEAARLRAMGVDVLVSSGVADLEPSNLNAGGALRPVWKFDYPPAVLSDGAALTLYRLDCGSQEDGDV